MKGYRPQLSQKSSGMGGRSNSGSLRSKSGPKVTAPLPVNLPSRKLESAGGQDSLFSSPGSSWASPSTTHAAALVASSTSSSPGMDGPSPVAPSTTHLSAAVPGAESPLSESSSAATTPKPPPRVWGVVAATADKNLAEFPTAAEASKMAGHDAQPDGGSYHPHQGTNGAKADEPNRSMSSISVENKWDEIDDENEDFLFAEKIEFADGAVNVKEVVNLVARSEETRPQQQQDTTTQIAPKREERIVDRSEDDFDRQWPHRHGPGAHGMDANSRYAHGTGDRSRQQLWQGGLPSSTRDSERRPSLDRDRRPSADHHTPAFGPPSNGRRESFGQRDSFRGNGPSRRDSGAGRLDSLGPPPREFGDRRDSFDHHRDRDYDYGRGRNYSRDREYGRGRADFSQDRRGSYDRRSRDGSSQRHDLHVLSRSRDSIAERGGDRAHEFAHHDGHGGGGGAGRPPYQDHGGSFGRQHPYAHVPPPAPGVVEFDRPSHVSEEQRETMKHAAEEARKRREEEERQREEARARAKAKADEIARAMEKQQKEKEESERAKKEEEKAKRAPAEPEKQLAPEADRAKAKTVSPGAGDREKVRNGKPRVLSSAERAEEDNAIAEWNALPAKLMQEGKEQAERIRAERRREEEERRGAAGTTNAWTSGQPTLAASWRRTEAAESETSISTSRNGVPVTNGGALRHESTVQPPPSSEMKEPTVGQIDSVMKNIKDHFDARGTSLEEMEASIKKVTQSQEAAAATATATATTPPVAVEGVTEAPLAPTVAARDIKGGASEIDAQSDKSLSTRDRLKLRGPRGGVERPGTAAPPASVAPSRADNASTWRREAPLPEPKPAPSVAGKGAKAATSSDSTQPSLQESAKGGMDDIERPGAEAVPAVSDKVVGDTVAARAKGKGSSGASVGKAASVPNGPVRPVRRREPSDYPARTVDLNHRPTISDITSLFAEISNLPAGESPYYDPTALKAATSQTTDIPNAVVSKAQVPGDAMATMTTTEKTGKDHPLKAVQASKRHSLSSMSASIVFPSNVEQAVNRGRMSFMVASEIDEEAVSEKEVAQSVPTSDKAEEVATVEQGSDTQGGTAQEDNLPKPATSAPSVFPSSVAIHPGMYGIQQGVSTGGAALPQYPWGGVESSQAGNLPVSTGMMMPPTGSTGHPMQPYQQVVHPFYTYMQPYFIPYNPRGPVHPSLAQYSAATAMVPGGQQSRMMMMDNATTAALATTTSQHDSFSSVSAVSSSNSSNSIAVTSNVSVGNLNNTASKVSATGTTATSASNQANETHPWLPRFSAAGDAPSATTATTQFPVAGPNIMAGGSQRGSVSTRPMSTHGSTYHQTMQDALGSSSSSPVTPTAGGFQSFGEEDGWSGPASFGAHSASAGPHGWGLPASAAGRMHVAGGGSGAGAGGGVGSGVGMTPGFVVPGQDTFHPQAQGQLPMHGRSNRGGSGGYSGHYSRGGYGSHHHQHGQHHHHHDGHGVHTQQHHGMSGNLMNPMAGVSGGGGGGSAGDRSQRPFGAPGMAPHHHGQTHFHGHQGPQGMSPHSRRVNSGANAATTGGGVAPSGGNPKGGAIVSEAGASVSSSSYAQF